MLLTSLSYADLAHTLLETLGACRCMQVCDILEAELGMSCMPLTVGSRTWTRQGSLTG